MLRLTISGTVVSIKKVLEKSSGAQLEIKSYG